jgi:hypothetical protein
MTFGGSTAELSEAREIWGNKEKTEETEGMGKGKGGRGVILRTGTKNLELKTPEIFPPRVRR